MPVFRTDEVENFASNANTIYLFVSDGELRLYTPSGIMDYVAGQYSVSAIDTQKRGYVIA